MQSQEDADTIIQGVTNEEKTFNAPEFGLLCERSWWFLGLDKRILKAVNGMGYTHPTLVQVE